MSLARASIVALAAGLLAALATAMVPHPIRLQGVGVGDIGLPLAGIDLFARGESPYALKLRATDAAMYPFTTLVVLWPLKLVPLGLAPALFFGVATAALAFAIARAGKPWHFLMFASPSYLSALESVQWAPIFVAALFVPAFLPIAVVKPHLGVVLAVAGKWSWRTLLAALLLVVASFAIYPGWLLDWLERGNLGTFTGRSPITVLPGFLLFAVVMALPSARARLLAAMSVVLQRYFYDQLPLFALPASWRQMFALVATSWAAVAVAFFAGWLRIGSGVQDARVWSAVIAGFFLPVLAMLLFEKREEIRARRPPPAEPIAGA